MFRGGKKNKGLALKRVAASALVAALEDEKAQPQEREHRSGGTRFILTGAALAAVGGLAWKAARARLPDLSDLKDRALDRLDDLGLLDEDVDDYVDDDEAYDEDDEPYEDEEEEEEEEEDDDEDEDEDDYDEDDEEVPDRESVLDD